MIRAAAPWPTLTSDSVPIMREIETLRIEITRIKEIDWETCMSLTSVFFFLNFVVKFWNQMYISRFRGTLFSSDQCDVAKEISYWFQSPPSHGGLAIVLQVYFIVLLFTFVISSVRYRVSESEVECKEPIWIGLYAPLFGGYFWCSVFTNDNSNLLHSTYLSGQYARSKFVFPISWYIRIIMILSLCYITLKSCIKSRIFGLNIDQNG